MSKIKVTDLSAAAVDETPVRVDGWCPEDYNSEADGRQTYEIVLPDDLCLNDSDIEEMSATECIQWFRDNDSERDGNIDKLLARRPRAGTVAQQSWLEDVRQEISMRLDGARMDYEESRAPMMNCYYPIPSLRGVDARILDGTNCTLVLLGDRNQYALVLNGGGMDFSWEIADAHIRLDLLPPAWIRLPHQAGYPKRAKLIIAACQRSQRVVQWRIANSLDHLRSLRADVEKGNNE